MDQAAALERADVTGRKIAYVGVPEETAKKALLDAGMPASVVDAMSELHAIAKEHDSTWKGGARNAILRR